MNDYTRPLRQILSVAEQQHREPPVVREGKVILARVPDPASLTDQAPELLARSIRALHEAAAKGIEDAYVALEAEVQSCAVMARDQAESLRAMGESQAATFESQASMVRTVSKSFREQKAFLDRCKVGGADKQES